MDGKAKAGGSGWGALGWLDGILVVLKGHIDTHTHRKDIMNAFLLA